MASNPNQTGPVGATSPTGTLAVPGVANTGTAVLPGTQLTYRLLVTNNGPSDIVNVQVSDTLPSNVTYVSANQSGGNATFTCFNTGGAVTCNAPLLPAAQPGVTDNTASIDIVVRIDPATKVNLVNNATARGTVNGFNQPVGAATQLTTPVQPVSDLVTTKTHTPDPVVAGTNLVYTVKVQNFGPSTAQMFQIVDQLPAGQTFVSAQVLYPAALPGMPPAVTCTGTTTVTCVGSMQPGYSLAPNDFITVQLTVAVDSCTAPGAYTNVATATSMSNLPAAPRNVGTDTVNVIARPDLAITKVDDPDPVIAGNTLTYTIEAVNNGPSCAQDVMITDPLPPGTVFLTATPSTGGVAAGTNPAVGANGTVKYTWPGLTGPGVKRTLTITVRVCPDVACDTVLSNTATVSYTPRIPVPNPNTGIVWDVDPVTSNNTATATTTVKAQSDLSLAKSGPSSAQYSTTNQQSIVSYTLSFSNAGPSNAAGVMIVDTLPKGFTLDSWSIAAPYTVNDVTVTATTLNGVTTVKFTLKNPLGAANQCATNFPTSGVITLKAVVPIKHPIVTVINSATISTTNCLADPNLANNTATAATFIVAPGTNPQTAYPAASEVSDIQGGSVLFYPIYTSDAANPNKQNTRINMTNVSTTENVCVHLFLVDGATCSVLDMFVCLTPNQTTTFLASDLDPGNTGYIMGVAVDCATGLPRAYNCLIGDAYVKFTSGHAANLGAEAIQALMMFPAGTDPNATLVDLKFDGMNYNRLPRAVAADNIQASVTATRL
ncbi:MAG: DUF11 domain-containing protein [Acidobacteria bacterium]|nr:DUF11 domain-containing protein [Acidobacteriota bacterium]